MTTSETDDQLKSKAGKAYHQIHLDILHGRLPAGTKLSFALLKQNYSFGVAPLREALVRLAAGGLVEGEEQRGFWVAAMSEAELLDLTKTSIQLESEAIRSAIDNATKSTDALVLSCFHHLEALSLTGGTDLPEFGQQWSDAHAAFHDSLVAACNSPSLLRLRKILYDQLDRYRNLSITISAGARDLNSEHRALMMAVLDRNPGEAARLVAQHWATTANVIIASSDLPAT